MLAEATKIITTTGSQHTDALLPYAQKTWTQHTRFFEDLDTYPQSCQLLDHPKFGIDFTTGRTEQIADGIRRNIHLSRQPQILWALKHVHVLCLKHDMTRSGGRRILQFFDCIYDLLQDVLFFKPWRDQTLEHHMLKWLVPITITLGLKVCTGILFNTISEIDYTPGMLLAAVYSRDIRTARLIVGQPTFDKTALLNIEPPLMDVCCSLGDPQMAHLLSKEGLACNRLENGRNLLRVFYSGLPHPTLLRFAQILFNAGLSLDEVSEDDFYLINRILLEPSSASPSIVTGMVSHAVTCFSSYPLLIVQRENEKCSTS